MSKHPENVGCVHFGRTPGKDADNTGNFLREHRAQQREDQQDPYPNVAPWEPLPVTPAPGATTYTNPDDEPQKPDLTKVDKDDLITTVTNPLDHITKGKPIAIDPLTGQTKENKNDADERVFLVMLSGAKQRVLNNQQAHTNKNQALIDSDNALVTNHVNHLNKLLDKGSLAHYGAFTDNDRGFQIFFAESKIDVDLV